MSKFIFRIIREQAHGLNYTNMKIFIAQKMNKMSSHLNLKNYFGIEAMNFHF